MQGLENQLNCSRLWTLLVASTVCLGCIDAAEEAGNGFASDDSSLVVAEVERALWAFHAADTTRDAEAVIGLLWPEFTMLGDGERAAYEDVAAGSREFMAGLELFHTEWTDIHIIPLGRDVALASFQFRDSIVTSSGNLIQARGPTTFVWQRREGEWRVLFADADHYPIER